jgi:hypothetical protein
LPTLPWQILGERTNKAPDRSVGGSGPGQGARNWIFAVLHTPERRLEVILCLKNANEK